MSTGSLDRVIFSPDSNVAWTLQTSYPKNGKYLDPITAPCGNVDSSYAIRHIAIKTNKAIELTMGVVFCSLHSLLPKTVHWIISVPELSP